MTIELPAAFYALSCKQKVVCASPIGSAALSAGHAGSGGLRWPVVELS